jgi:DNA-binding NtrC family response regulator
MNTAPPYALVIDPASMVAETVSVALDHAGYRTTHAHTYDEAQRALAQGPTPDLIVSHYNFPEQPSGPSLIQATMEAHPRVPVVVISSRPQHELPLKPGRWVFLSKPFGMQELLEAIDAAKAAESAN